MSQAILFWSLTAGQVMLALALAFAAFRLFRGPRAQDRVLSLDAMYTIAMLLLITIGIRAGSAVYFEAAVAIALLGFTASVALSKFLMRGEVIE